MMRKSLLVLSAALALPLMSLARAEAGSQISQALVDQARLAPEPAAGPPMSAMEQAEKALLSQPEPVQGERELATDRGRSIAKEGAGDDDEYNFSWLDPDKKVYVLQNRKYRKKNRLFVFASGGVNLSNPYRSEYMFVPRGAFWFSEQFGVEVFGSIINNSDNANLTALKAASASALPFVRENRSYVGGALAWNPWYAKLNFFNKILYFDWLLLAGVGQTSTAIDQNRVATQRPDFRTESQTTFFFGTAQQYYVSRNFLVRMDLIGMMYNATSADNVTKRNITNFDFTLGIGWGF